MPTLALVISRARYRIVRLLLYSCVWIDSARIHQHPIPPYSYSTQRSASVHGEESRLAVMKHLIRSLDEEQCNDYRVPFKFNLARAS